MAKRFPRTKRGGVRFSVRRPKAEPKPRFFSKGRKANGKPKVRPISKKRSEPTPVPITSIDPRVIYGPPSGAPIIVVAQTGGMPAMPPPMPRASVAPKGHGVFSWLTEMDRNVTENLRSAVELKRLAQEAKALRTKASPALPAPSVLDTEEDRRRRSRDEEKLEAARLEIWKERQLTDEAIRLQQERARLEKETGATIRQQRLEFLRERQKILDKAQKDVGKPSSTPPAVIISSASGALPLRPPFCRKCGLPIPSDSKLCPRCNTPRIVEYTTPNVEEKEPPSNTHPKGSTTTGLSYQIDLMEKKDNE